MRTRPPPGKKLVTAWKGLTVRTLRRMRNGVTDIPAGTLATVTYARAGLTLETEPCKCCGVSIRISKVSSSDVSVTTPPTGARNGYGN